MVKLKGKTPQPGPTPGKRKSVPYNARVAHDRKERYYNKAKTHAKYGRLLRYEERQAEAEAAGDARKLGSRQLYNRVLADGAAAVDDEYERKLALSFGGEFRRTEEVEQPPARKKKKKKKLEAPVVEATEGDEIPRARRKKERREQSADAEVAAAPASSESRKRKPTYEASEADRGNKWHQMHGAASTVPNRFSKERREYEKKQEAVEEERAKKLEEEQERNKRRRDFAKNRAVKGQRLEQKTKWGQPKMASLMQDLTSKIAATYGKRL